MSNSTTATYMFIYKHNNRTIENFCFSHTLMKVKWTQKIELVRATSQENKTIVRLDKSPNGPAADGSTENIERYTLFHPRLGQQSLR